MEWETTLPENPFAPALRLLRDNGAGASSSSSCEAEPAAASAATATGGSRSRGKSDDQREEQKMMQYMRQFEEMKAKEERRKKMQALKEEREASDPCKCGRARAKRLPRPLATGGPRCNRCLPLEPPRPATALRDAPVFMPTEEEFRDPMSYIRSIQADFYDTGICTIQPPPSWQPPKSFHWRENEEEEDDDEEEEEDDEADAEAEEAEGEEGKPHGRPGSAGDSASTSSSAGEGEGEGEGGGNGGGGGSGGGGGGAAAAKKAPAVRRQTSAGYSSEPITDEKEVYARLQTIRARRKVNSHGAPFTCKIVPRYAKYAMAELRRLDAALREEVFPDLSELPHALPPPDAVEEWFWEGLASEAEARILYSSDLEGTAFPETGTYGEHAWSLQKLANHERSLLRFVEYSIPGVNTPMLYFGMLFSMFCWHVEDNYMYSISYLHEGAPKTWYGVSPAHASGFDRVFNTSGFAAEVEADPQLIFKKSAMLPPSLLLDEGVPVSRALQQPGQFVVTLPQAYHAGFSHGFNTAEAVNFMLLDWLPYARASMARYRAINREPVLDLEQILVKASLEHHSREVATEAAAMVAEELRLRDALRDTGCAEQPMENKDKLYALGRGPPCFRCAHVCHLSFAQLGTDRSHSAAAARSHRLEACLKHATELLEQRGAGDGDDSPPLTLFTRHPDEWLQQLTQRHQAKKHKPAATLQPPADPPPFHTLPPSPPSTEKQSSKKQRLRR